MKSLILICASLVLTACNGPKGNTGPSGQGPTGSSCTVVQIGANAVVTCTDGTSATIGGSSEKAWRLLNNSNLVGTFGTDLFSNSGFLNPQTGNIILLNQAQTNMMVFGYDPVYFDSSDCTGTMVQTDYSGGGYVADVNDLSSVYLINYDYQSWNYASMKATSIGSCVNQVGSVFGNSISSGACTDCGFDGTMTFTKSFQ